MQTETFEEITFSNGKSEAMAHKTPTGKWIAFYAYRRDVADGEYPAAWKWRDGMNRLFVHLVSPLPSKAVASLRARGFSGS